MSFSICIVFFSLAQYFATSFGMVLNRNSESQLLCLVSDIGGKYFFTVENGIFCFVTFCFLKKISFIHLKTFPSVQTLLNNFIMMASCVFSSGFSVDSLSCNPVTTVCHTDLEILANQLFLEQFSFF